MISIIESKPDGKRGSVLAIYSFGQWASDDAELLEVLNLTTENFLPTEPSQGFLEPRLAKFLEHAGWIVDFTEDEEDMPPDLVY